MQYIQTFSPRKTTQIKIVYSTYFKVSSKIYIYNNILLFVFNQVRIGGCIFYEQQVFDGNCRLLYTLDLVKLTLSVLDQKPLRISSSVFQSPRTVNMRNRELKVAYIVGTIIDFGPCITSQFMYLCEICNIIKQYGF